MKSSASGKRVTAKSRRPWSGRLWGREHDEGTPDRRDFLRAIAFQGVSLPAVNFMLGSDLSDQSALESQAIVKTSTCLKCTMPQVADAAADGPDSGLIMRDFANPDIELIRLVREADPWEARRSLDLSHGYREFSSCLALTSLRRTTQSLEGKRSAL